MISRPFWPKWAKQREIQVYESHLSAGKRIKPPQREAIDVGLPLELDKPGLLLFRDAIIRWKEFVY